MTKELFDQIVAVLLPEMDDPKERRELIQKVLAGSSVIQKLNWKGNASTFTRRLVQVLDEYGNLANGQSAIAAILLAIQQRTGTNRQGLQTALAALLRQLTPPTFSEKKYAKPPAISPMWSESIIQPASHPESKSAREEDSDFGGEETSAIEKMLRLKRDEIQFSPDDLSSFIGLPKSKPAPAPPAPPTTAKFSFRLEGKDTFGDQVKCGTEVDLIFDYNHLSDKILAVIQGRELSSLLHENGVLGISIIPKGFTTRDGKWHQTVPFQNGKLQEAVRFQLKASDAPVDGAGVYVSFDKAGAVIYEFQLAIQLVMSFNISDISKLSILPPAEMDLDEMMAVQEEPRTARLVLWLDGDSIHYSLIQQDDLEQPLAGEFQKITRTSLSDCLGKIQSILKPVSEHIIWNKLGYRIDAPQNEGEHRAFGEFMERVATAGSILYFSLAEDDECRQLLETINALAPDSRLSISTDCAFLPWEILYPHRYNFEWPDATKKKAPLQVQDFWGYRFAIECLLKAKAAFKIPYRAHQTAQPFLSCNFNPTIDAIGGAAYKPVTDQETWAKQLDASQYRIDVRKTGQDIKTMLFTPDYEATVIYLYCHGSNDKPLQDSQKELLELDEGILIDPNLLTDGSTFKHGPIVFLNSCSSGAFSPLAFSTFLTRFREKQALGLIATNFPVPAAFAAKFGWEIIERYIQPPTKTLGDVLLQERRRLLDARNPLGLFYSLQCPMGITARPVK